MTQPLAHLLRDLPLLSVTRGGVPVSADATGDFSISDLCMSDLCISSRDVTPGALFVAIVGSSTDGHRFLKDAIERGASAVVVSRDVEVPPQVVCIRVDETREALTHLAAVFFGDPSRALTLIGITGTNGKTTSTYLIEAIFAAAGYKPGVIGTVNYRYLGNILPSPNTTPDLVTFSRLLRSMQDAGVDCVIAEVSSHALDQKRVEGLHFDAGVFTNLTRDHLDYHGDFESYFQAKRRLFTELLGSSAKPLTVAITNCDDEAGRQLRAQAQAKIRWGFSHTVQTGKLQAETGYELQVLESRLDFHGIDARVSTPRGILHLKSRLLGPHNLENLLGAAGVALGLGIEIPVIEQALETFRAVPGRLEEVEVPTLASQSSPKVLVDYAHTDDALERVLSCLRPLVPGAILTVFGCGGDRDKGKRPLMGAAAAHYSELSILTSDNPRTEDPQAILDDILPGIPADVSDWSVDQPLVPGARFKRVESDRRQAIRTAIWAAQPGDVVLIAGKGHEDYQIIGTEKLHFDDREEAMTALTLRTEGRL